MTAPAADPQEPKGKKKGARANREGKPWKRADGRWVMRLSVISAPTTEADARRTVEVIRAAWQSVRGANAQTSIVSE